MRRLEARINLACPVISCFTRPYEMRSLSWVSSDLRVQSPSTVRESELSRRH